MAEGNRQDRVTGTGADAPPYLVSAEEAVSLHGLLCARVARTPDAIAYREHNNGSWHPFTWRETMEGVRRYQAAEDLTAEVPWVTEAEAVVSPEALRQAEVKAQRGMA